MIRVRSSIHTLLRPAWHCIGGAIVTDPAWASTRDDQDLAYCPHILACAITGVAAGVIAKQRIARVPTVSIGSDLCFVESLSPRVSHSQRESSLLLRQALAQADPSPRIHSCSCNYLGALRTRNCANPLRTTDFPRAHTNTCGEQRYV